MPGCMTGAIVSLLTLAPTGAKAAQLELIYNGVFNTQDALNPASQSSPTYFPGATPFTINAWFDTDSPNLAPHSPPAPPPFAGFRAYCALAGHNRGRRQNLRDRQHHEQSNSGHNRRHV